MKNDHLTSEQMEGLLSDPKRKGESQHLESRHLESRHLDACEDCSEEFESLLRTIHDLRTSAIASAAQHRRSAQVPAASHRMPRMACAALTAAAVLCIAGPLAVRPRPERIAAANAPRQQMQGTVSDAQLMSDVQSDLSSQVPGPMLPLAASAASTAATTSTNSSTY